MPPQLGQKAGKLSAISGTFPKDHVRSLRVWRECATCRGLAFAVRVEHVRGGRHVGLP